MLIRDLGRPGWALVWVGPGNEPAAKTYYEAVLLRMPDIDTRQAAGDLLDGRQVESKDGILEISGNYRTAK